MENPTQFNPFLGYSVQLNAQFQAAKATDNPAFYLYKNGARNIVFMLEALTRLHKNAFDDAKMEKWYDRFKQLEDLLGQIDHLDAFKNKLERDKILTEKDGATLSKKIEKPMAELNNLLKSENWLDNKLLKFDAFIVENKFKYNQKYTAIIVKAYQKEIKKITAIATELKFKLTAVEEHVHELRRRLRWLSIYPQAFGGLFQFEKPETHPEWSTKYMLEDIVNSPFNQLPKTVDNLPIIYLNYPNFIALSFIIQEFGKLKDKGLLNMALATELNKSKTDIKQLLGDTYTDEKTILTTASQLLKTFFEDKVLVNLVKN
jgi:hypothetical protein